MLTLAFHTTPLAGEDRQAAYGQCHSCKECLSFGRHASRLTQETYNINKTKQIRQKRGHQLGEPKDFVPHSLKASKGDRPAILEDYLKYASKLKEEGVEGSPMGEHPLVVTN